MIYGIYSKMYYSKRYFHLDGGWIIRDYDKKCVDIADKSLNKN